MNSKAVIAIVAAIIIVVAGVAAYLVINGGGDAPVDKKVDNLRTDVVVGDYIEQTSQISASSEQSIQESADLFFYTLYPQLGSYYEVVGDKVLSYKGVDICCDIYMMEGTTYGFYMYNGVCYGQFYGLENPMEMLLVDTSFDLSKTKAQQQLKVGDYISSKLALSETAMITVNTVESYDDATGEWNIKVKSTTSKPVISEEKRSIIEIEEDKLTVYTDESEDTETMTKAEYLSTISYSNMLKHFEDEGIKYVIGKKTSETITTAYGDRYVDVQQITYTYAGEELQMSAYYCGDVIYQISVLQGDSSVIVKLKSSSLITPAN